MVYKMGRSDFKIFIIDDNETMCKGMCESLRREGYSVRPFSNPEQAVKDLNLQSPDLVITDLRMEPLDGIQVLKQVKEKAAECNVILISAYGTVEKAVQALQLGAIDFLTKPFSNEELRARVKKVYDYFSDKKSLQELKEENAYLNEEISKQYPEIIGRSEPMQEILQLISKVARGDSALLIEGESGTGKELVARAIHRMSPRSGKPFVRVNCGVLNDNLLESELFGHEQGAFTGALKQRKGRFELANKGTLFLDEIGEISSAMQIKLLRALQQKEFERVGGEQTISVDIRIIAATNRDLAKLVNDNKFREDLYYRINVIPIKLPSLRERKEDIIALIEYFVDKFSPVKTTDDWFQKEALELLKTYNWPGNIRELENFIERLIVIFPEGNIDAKNVAKYLGHEIKINNSFEHLPLDDALYRFEEKMIKKALQDTAGNKNKAAKLLGIKTSAFYYKLEKFGLLK